MMRHRIEPLITLPTWMARHMLTHIHTTGQSNPLTFFDAVPKKKDA